jgi:hypothetical protein
MHFHLTAEGFTLFLPLIYSISGQQKGWLLDRQPCLIYGLQKAHITLEYCTSSDGG